MIYKKWKLQYGENAENKKFGFETENTVILEEQKN